MSAHRIVSVAVAALLSGCWLALDLDDKEFTLSGGSGGAGGGATAATGGAGGHAGMVEVTVPGQGSFLIDATEVTVSAYAAWLATSPSISAQEPRCDWNDSFVPGVCSGGPCSCDGITLESELAVSPSVPVRCVDFCDAVAFCAAQGKHLCGGIGSLVLAGDPSASNDPARSEWFFACSNGGTRELPYGDTYAPQTCIDAGVDWTRPNDVGTLSCEGGVDGVFDMSGNVEEWVDHCYMSQGMACFRPGGAFWHEGQDNLDCDIDWPQSTDAREHSPSTGFRCCADS
jgi:formylglycine-generating enzyme required for sulfatase activity